MLERGELYTLLLYPPFSETLATVADVTSPSPARVPRLPPSPSLPFSQPQDPQSVHVSWQTYFKGLDNGLPSSAAYTPPPAYRAGLDVAVGSHPVDAAPGMSMAGAGGSEVTDHLKVSVVVVVVIVVVAVKEIPNLPTTGMLTRDSFLRLPGPVARPCLPSPRSPHCQARPSWNPRS